jgi:uncharacterized protein
MFFVIMVTLLFSSLVFADDWDDAWNTFKRGDYKEASKMLRPFAEKGDTTAQYYLGLMYKEGKGVSRNFKEAAKWIQLVAEKGDATAQYQIAEMHEKGEGVPKSAKKAVRWYRKVALKGYVDAQYKLGEMYENGQGVSKNLKEALEWYKLVAGQKYMDAQHKVGQMYYQGRGTIKDYLKAFEWYELSADKEYGPAQADLGRMYHEGRGVSKDYIKAYMWLTLALANGDESVNKLIDKLEKEMTPRQILQSHSLARSWRPGTLKIPSSQPSTSPKDHAVLHLGTGFFVSSDGHILTNHHVVKSCAKVQARGYGRLQLIAQDQRNDLALLKTGSPPKEVSVFRERSIKHGNTVFAAGFPLQNTLAEAMNFTEGTVSAMAGLKGDSRFIQITAPVQKGNSGGPLLDKYGMITGIVTSKYNALASAIMSGDIPQNINFAIKASIAKIFLETNEINYLSSLPQEKKENSILAEYAKKITLAIECAN